MTKEKQKPGRPSPEKPAAVSKRSAVLAALSLLGASIGLSLDDSAKGGEIKSATGGAGAGKAKFNEFQVNRGSTAPTALPKPGSTSPTVLPKQPAINAITVKQK
jgi:hypothetical protein